MPEFQIAKILILSTLAFIFAILWTPLLTHYLYKYKLGKSIRNSGKTPIFSKLHAHKAGTPTMGGILIWLTLLILIIFFSFIGDLLNWQLLKNLNFPSLLDLLPHFLLPFAIRVET
jgi:phospho-N-acetylmuramoyl-pentapeptide-transferase